MAAADLSTTCSYEFLKKIGRGNYGTAWLVRRTFRSDIAGAKVSSAGAEGGDEDEEHVVIKKIQLLSMKDSEVAQAKSEVTLLKALKHPNIVRTIESFEEDDSLHIVMEYCECGDLAMRIKSQAKMGEKFSRRRVLEWFVQIVSAVGHIHSKKILHRDLKTNNVFLARNNVIKLGDFGIAKALQTASMADTVIGTPYYMSPEICSNTPYSYESDMWSLGCILHELCTLKHTFDSNNLLGLVFQIMQANPPPISSEYGEDVQSLLNKLLNKDKTLRPSAIVVLHDACLKEAAKFIVDNLTSTGTLGTGGDMVLPPSPPPTPKKPARPGSEAQTHSSSSKTGTDARVTKVRGEGETFRPAVRRAGSSPVEPVLPERKTTDSPQIIGKTTSERKREQRKKHLLSKANIKRRSAAAVTSSADAGPHRYLQQDLTLEVSSADGATETNGRIPQPTRPQRALSQPTVPEEYSRAKEIQRLKQARKDRANADRLEELRKANMEHMRERSRAKERRNKEFRPSSVNHSLGQMGGPLSSPASATAREHMETPRYSILDLASPSHIAARDAALGHGAEAVAAVGDARNHSATHVATRSVVSPTIYHNAADERPIRSRYSQERMARATRGLRDLNPYRSGQEQHYSPDVGVARKQMTGSSFLGGDDDYDSNYGWKKGDGEDAGNDINDVSDEYSDDDDHYDEDSDDFESDNTEDSDAPPAGDDRQGALQTGGSKKSLQPRASKWVRMDEQEVLRRQDQGRRDAEEVAAQMRGVVGADSSVSRTKKPRMETESAPPIKINASMRQSYQRMRDEHQDSAEAGLGRRVFQEVLEVYRSVAANGDAALDGVEMQAPKRNYKRGKGGGKRRGKKRAPTKLMLRIMQIVGDDPTKLKLCTKIEELVFLEQAFLK